ncbi:MAG: hypothetical protein JWQ48_1706 [Conexibacter sp.]|nr:hypothetical protein [Conexibacter sp.]
MTSSWWLLVVVGLMSVAAGIVVLAKPSDSLTTLSVVAGIFLLSRTGFDGDRFMWVEVVSR